MDVGFVFIKVIGQHPKPLVVSSDLYNILSHMQSVDHSSHKFRLLFDQCTYVNTYVFGLLPIFGIQQRDTTREKIKELCVRSVVVAEAESIDRTEVNDDNTGPASNTFHFVK